MTDSNDYRLYLEKSFRVIDEKLDTIVTQTTRTNCRVNHLEEKSNERQVVIDDFRHLEKEFECVKQKVDKIDNDLLEVWFFKKYPRVFIGILTVAIIVALILVRSKINTVNETVRILDQKVDLINVPMRTRGGSVVLVPSGIYLDSLNKDTIKK
jgi:hypothetical protein